jgi:hypothetical protein
MAEVGLGEQGRESKEVGDEHLSMKKAILDKFFYVVAEFLLIISLFVPWFSIQMKVPLMNIQMNGTYDFFLFNRMQISIEGLPGAFAGAVTSEETILAYVHPLFWSPVLGIIVGLWPLMKLFRGKPYQKQALISAVLITIIAVEMRYLSITLGKRALADFVALMESIGAELSFSSLGSNLYLVFGVFMLVTQAFSAFRTGS